MARPVNLRAALLARAQRRHRHGVEDRGDQIDALKAGRDVVVSFAQLKSALWEAGLTTADELHEMYNRAARWVVHADGTYEPAGRSA